MTDEYRHRTTLQVRFRDIDAFGHVNNAVFASYAEQARIRYLLDVLQPSGGFDRQPLILARVAIDYRSPILMHDGVVVDTRVDGIGHTSFRMSHRLTSQTDGRVLADVESVLVAYDYAAARPIRVPDEWRDRLEAHEGRSLHNHALPAASPAAAR